MRIAFLSLTLLLLASCSQVDSEEEVLQSVKEIYSKANDVPQDFSVFSSSFRSLLDKVNKVDEGAELGYLDHAILTQAQDSVGFTDFIVVDITKSRSNVRVVKSYGDTLRVELLKENGVWKVDNVNDERQQMEDYCKDAEGSDGLE